MRDGWPGLNALTGGASVLPDAAVDLFDFSGGQATFDAMVQVAPARGSGIIGRKGATRFSTF